MMKIMKVEQPQKNNSHLALGAAIGVVGGSAARYFAPSRQELSLLASKHTTDTFVSSIKNHAQNRSAVKYAGIGALIAVGAKALYDIFKKNNNVQPQEKRNYSKAEIIAEIPDVAISYVWGDELN